MLGSILTGVIGDRFGYSRAEVIAMFALVVGLAFAPCGNAPLDLFRDRVLARDLHSFADRLALYNLSMAFSPHEDNTAYLGVVPAIVAPVQALVARSSGGFIDRFGFLLPSRRSVSSAP
jgi:hypothetical protein